MRNSAKRLLGLGLCLAILAIGVGIVVLFTPLGLALRQNPGSFDRTHFEAIVAQARTLALVPEKEIELRLDDPDNPASLRPVKPTETFHRGTGGGTVWAIVKKDGSFAVTIETRDLGHAGEYGFAYSDAPLIPKPFGGSWNTLDVPGRLNLVKPDMKIDDHWWKVLNNLD